MKAFYHLVENTTCPEVVTGFRWERIGGSRGPRCCHFPDLLTDFWLSPKSSFFVLEKSRCYDECWIVVVNFDVPVLSAGVFLSAVDIESLIAPNSI